jgi:2-desacetyl-2-hydroxyethyl bacteriochlorophyllide A dehydrogenase
MKAIVCNRPFSLGIEERPVPERKTGEVTIRIRRVGLCGTDYHIFSGNQPFLAYPRVMGHELAGEVAEVDEGGTLKIGQIVTINPYIPCGVCIACRKEKPNCCVNINVLGVHVDGGMTEFICVPAAAVIPVDGLSLDQAAMVEFLSVGAHAVRRGQVTRADRALVVGAGPIGVGVALFCQFAGADVTLIDTSEDRLTYAHDKINIAHVVQVGEGLDEVLKARSDGEFFDVVFDATGSGKAIEKGFSYVAHGGRYVLVSVVKDIISFSDPEFHKRETTLLGSRNATREDFEYVIEHLRNGAIPSDMLQTHNFDFMDTPTMIKDLMANQGSVLKAIATF